MLLLCNDLINEHKFYKIYKNLLHFVCLKPILLLLSSALLQWRKDFSFVFCKKLVVLLREATRDATHKYNDCCLKMLC